MPNTKIRADHDALAQIAQSFQARSESTTKAHTNLKNKMGVLQGGDWVGKAATKFYKEMEGQVLPAVQRLAQALALAAQTTRKISALMRQTEDEAARLFRLTADGAWSNSDSGAAAMSGPSPHMSAPDANFVTVNSRGEITEHGFRSSISGLEASRMGSNPDISQETRDGWAVDRILNRFDPAVREIVKKSPNLTQQLKAIERDGYFIEVGESGKGSDCDTTIKRITVEGGRTPEQMAGTIAHEVGHAQYHGIQYHPIESSANHDDYIESNVWENLRDEGNAQMNRAAARAEILENGGPDIGFNSNADQYIAIYDDYRNQRITQDEAIDLSADLMGEATTSTTNENYRVYYGKGYEELWNTHLANTEGGQE